MATMLWVLVLILGLLPSCAGPQIPPGTVVVALDTGPVNLDPRIGTDATSERLIQLMFGSLVKRSKQSGIEPDLATSWETPDPTTYIFHLREGVKFHDGRPLTSADVLFTFHSVLDGSIRTAKAGTYRIIQSIETPDDHTVVFKLKEPFAPFLWNLTRGAIGIVPAGSPVDFARKPIGTGAFKLVRNVQDAEVVIERNDDYYGNKPSITTVQFKIVPEGIVRGLELRKGSVDIAENVLPPDMVEALRGNPQLEIMQAPGTNYQYLAFNLKDAAFKDLRVRQAIAYAIDRKKIAEYLWRRQARNATGVIPPNNWSYSGEVETYPFDPEHAKSLLKEAGYPNLSFTFRTSQDDTARLLASVFQQQLLEVGIHMDIRSNEFATFYADVQKGNFQAYSLRWVGGNNDPDIFQFIFHSKMTPPAGANRGFYSNPEVDQLIEMARKETDMQKRKDAYARIQKIVAQELPYLSLWYMDNVAVYNKRITGMELYPAGDYEFLAGIQVR